MGRPDPHVTSLGHSLIQPIAAIGDWAEAPIGQIATAQAAYDTTRTR